MKLTNNQIALIAILFMTISLVCNFMIYQRASTITGRSTATGEVSLCLNHPPVLSMDCSSEAFIGVEYSCDVNASDYDNTITEGIQSFTFRDNTTLFDINPATGLIQFTPTAAQAGNHIINITVEDNSTCANSMDSDILNLIIRYIEVPVSAPSAGGGGGGGAAVERELARKVLLEFDAVPSQTMFSGDEKEILIKLKNKGDLALNNIILDIETFAPDLRLSLSDDFLEKLDVAEEARLILKVKSLTGPKAHIGIGRYIVTVNANVGYLGYKESVSFVIEVRERDYEARVETEKQIEFVEDFFKEHPECLEFEDMIKQAKDYYDASDYDRALPLIDSAIQACRDLIAPEEEEVAEKPAPPKKAADIVLFSIEIIIVIVLLAAIYYYYRRRRYRTAAKAKQGLNSRFYRVFDETRRAMRKGDIANAGRGYIALHALYKKIISSSEPDSFKAKCYRKLAFLHARLAREVEKKRR